MADDEAAEAGEDAPSFTLVETPVTIGDRIVVNGKLGGFLRSVANVLQYDASFEMVN